MESQCPYCSKQNICRDYHIGEDDYCCPRFEQIQVMISGLGTGVTGTYQWESEVKDNG